MTASLGAQDELLLFFELEPTLDNILRTLTGIADSYAACIRVVVAPEDLPALIDPGPRLNIRTGSLLVELSAIAGSAPAVAASVISVMRFILRNASDLATLPITVATAIQTRRNEFHAATMKLNGTLREQLNATEGAEAASRARAAGVPFTGRVNSLLPAPPPEPDDRVPIHPRPREANVQWPIVRADSSVVSAGETSMENVMAGIRAEVDEIQESLVPRLEILKGQTTDIRGRLSGYLRGSNSEEAANADHSLAIVVDSLEQRCLPGAMNATKQLQEYLAAR